MCNFLLDISFPRTLIASLTQCSRAHAELDRATLNVGWDVTIPPALVARVERARKNVVLAEAYHKRFIRSHGDTK